MPILDVVRPGSADHPTLPGEVALSAAVRAGDAAGFAEAVRDWSPALLRAAAAMLPPGSDAEAVVRRTWLALVDRLGCLPAPPRLWAWVCALLVRELPALDAPAPPLGPSVDPRRFRASDDPSWPGHWSVPPADWAPLASADDVRTAVAGALATLPQPQRIVVCLRDVAGCEVAEVAWIVGLEPARTRRLLHHARAALRASIEDRLAS